MKDWYFLLILTSTFASVAELVDALDSKSRFEKEKIVCRSGGIGRHAGFKTQFLRVRVRFPPGVPEGFKRKLGPFFYFSGTT